MVIFLLIPYSFIHHVQLDQFYCIFRLLFLNNFVSNYLWLMHTMQIINGDSLILIFLSFNLCSLCLSALSGHLGNLHHYHISPAPYLSSLTLFLAWCTTVALDFDKQTLYFCLCLFRTHSPPVFCQMTVALCWWMTLPANGQLQLTQRRRGEVPWRKACMCFINVKILTSFK